MTKAEALALTSADLVALIEKDSSISEKLASLLSEETERYVATFRTLFASGVDPAATVQAFAEEPPAVRVMTWVRVHTAGATKADLAFIKYTHQHVAWHVLAALGYSAGAPLKDLFADHAKSQEPQS